MMQTTFFNANELEVVKLSFTGRGSVLVSYNKPVKLPRVKSNPCFDGSSCNCNSESINTEQWGLEIFEEEVPMEKLFGALKNARDGFLQAKELRKKGALTDPFTIYTDASTTTTGSTYTFVPNVSYTPNVGTGDISFGCLASGNPRW